MDLRIAPQAKTGLHQRMVPKLMMVNTLLVLPLDQLLARIEQELAENPALERDDTVRPDEITWSRAGERSAASWTPDDEDRDPFAGLTSSVSLHDHLLLTLQAERFTPREHAIGARLIGYINDRGYLDVAIVQVAQELNAEPDDVERVLRRIQRFDPIGIGARSVQESLSVQLEMLDDVPARRLAQQLVAAYLTQLAEHRFDELAKALGARPAEVKEALAFLQTHCYASPGERYRADQTGGAVAPSEVAYPDVLIRRTDDGFAVELTHQDGSALRVNAFYDDLRRQLRRSAGSGEWSKDHVRDYVTRAKLFVEALQRRNWTLANIVQAVVSAQWEYLDRGDAHLKPLTKAMIAAELGISESTVSRALDSKFVQLPSGRVSSFDVFFDQSVPVKEKIRAIVAAEPHPLTDEEIATALTRVGYRVARRTVAKYREAISIPPSTKRTPALTAAS
ncbi:MAG TPA: RNA polymerase factor sigma-54 [bacterium]|jgi:RNA polymerase sigma-54 factor